MYYSQDTFLQNKTAGRFILIQAISKKECREI